MSNDDNDNNGELKIYSFGISSDKGRKALVRFRENLRKYFPQCGYSKGLTIREEPVLQLFYYDSATEIGYCRLYSKQHEGPIFPNPKKLYETYNCSVQGHINEVFHYMGSPDDPDNGMELTKFLEKYDVESDKISPETLKQLEHMVNSNKLLNTYSDALKEKKKNQESTRKNHAVKRRFEETQNDVAAVSDSSPSAIEENVEPSPSKTATTDETSATTAAVTATTAATNNERADQADVSLNESISDKQEDKKKKKPGRPKGSKGNAPNVHTKRTKHQNAGNTTTTSSITNNTYGPICQLIPASIQSLDINDSDINNVSASFSYQSQNVRLGDLPLGCVERSALCWQVFSFVVFQKSESGVRVDPNMTAEEFIKKELASVMDE